MKLQKKASFGRAACSSRSPPPLPLPLSLPMPPPPPLRDFLGYLEMRRLNLRSADSASAGWPTRNPDSGLPDCDFGQVRDERGTRASDLRREKRARENESRWKQESRATEPQAPTRREEEALADAARHATAALARSLARGTGADVFGSVNSASTFFK